MATSDKPRAQMHRQTLTRTHTHINTHTHEATPTVHMQYNHTEDALMLNMLHISPYLVPPTCLLSLVKAARITHKIAVS